MSDTDSSGAGTPAASAHDDHGHAADPETLGPVDVTTWIYALAGAAVGLLVAVAMFIARGA